jgi:hypothetical protein
MVTVNAGFGDAHSAVGEVEYDAGEARYFLPEDGLVAPDSIDAHRVVESVPSGDGKPS